jgi:lipid-A-disaccharide synthase
MQQIALRLQNRCPDISVSTIAVDEDKKAMLERSSLSGFESDYIVGSVSSTALKVDFCIVASGSATLQVAAAGCPMVIMYQSSKLLWHIVGRWLIKSEFLSLVNILASKELVPEFMPYFSSIEPIAVVIEKLLEDPDKLSQVSEDLINLTRPLASCHASLRVSEIVIDML